MAGAIRIERKRERGAALVEAAIITPIFFFLIFVLIDASFYFGERTALAGAVKNAARASSAAGADALADYDSLQAIKNALGIVPDSNVRKMVIFHASGFTDTVPSDCKAGVAHLGNGVGSCNVYVPNDLKRPTTDYGVGGWAGDDFWPAWTRDDHRTSSDYVGVYIEAKCLCMTGVFNPGAVMSAQTILRIEPKQDG